MKIFIYFISAMFSMLLFASITKRKLLLRDAELISKDKLILSSRKEYPAFEATFNAVSLCEGDIARYSTVNQSLYH